jgi:hypothetical protein
MPRSYLQSRVERLTAQISPIHKDAALRQAVVRDIMREFARLKASRATNTFRGGVPMEPEDIPGKILGPTYTTGEMMELAARRVFECEGIPDERLEGLVQRWEGVFERWFTRQGRDWNRVEGEG